MPASVPAPSQHRGLRVLSVVVLLAALLASLGTVLACRFGIACPFEMGGGRAELSAADQRVIYRAAGRSVEEMVLPGESRKVSNGDAVDVDNGGEAWLRCKDFLLLTI